jgi:hypothetical protein
MAEMRRQIDAIYLQLDTLLTSLAEIQLEMDKLRTKFRQH